MGHWETVLDQFCKIKVNKSSHAQCGALLTNIPETYLLNNINLLFLSGLSRGSIVCVLLPALHHLDIGVDQLVYHFLSIRVTIYPQCK